MQELDLTIASEDVRIYAIKGIKNEKLGDYIMFLIKQEEELLEEELKTAANKIRRNAEYITEKCNNYEDEKTL